MAGLAAEAAWADLQGLAAADGRREGCAADEALLRHNHRVVAVLSNALESVAVGEPRVAVAVVVAAAAVLAHADKEHRKGSPGSETLCYCVDDSCRDCRIDPPQLEGHRERLAYHLEPHPRLARGGLRRPMPTVRRSAL